MRLYSPPLLCFIEDPYIVLPSLKTSLKSFNFSLIGKDAEGNWLMGGKFMAVWALTHDLEHGTKNYGLPNSSSQSFQFRY